jgi:broad specificity phosphatase PhoE
MRRSNPGRDVLTEPVVAGAIRGSKDFNLLGTSMLGTNMSVGVRVLLVRHGETVWNQENRWQGQADVPLSEVGREQARRLAQRLRAERRHVRAIYASDLQRALQTAAILGDVLGVPLIPEVGWREMDIGTWSGLTTAEVIARYAAEWERLRAGEDLPRGGGETFAQFQGRILQCVRRLIERHAGEQVVVVTHGGAVRALLLHCRGLDMSQFRQIDKIGNTGVSEVTFLPTGEATIHSVNDTTHLDRLPLCGEAVDA